MLSEIGSEFWQKYDKSNKKDENEIVVLSGRTALDFVIRDLKASGSFRTIMLPSYCCDSMIEPFVRNDIEVSFYLVSHKGIDFPENDKDAVLLLDYFGYVDDQITRIANRAKENGQYVIYDATHYLGEREIVADYYFRSYRKWFFCNYASVIKANGSWKIPFPTQTNSAYIEQRNKAAELKRDYIASGVGEKNAFLKRFSNAEELLEEDYLNYFGEKVACNVTEIADVRRANARRLVEGLRGIKEITLWREQIEDIDTPLFVPILVADSIRNELRKYLIEHQIFCPIHWPITELHSNINELFDNELSLICDQRYSFDEIDRELEVISNFFKVRKE